MNSFEIRIGKELVLAMLLCTILFQTSALGTQKYKPEGLLIPLPQEVAKYEGVFHLTPNMQISFNSNKLFNEVGTLHEILISLLGESALNINKVLCKERKSSGAINLLINDKVGENCLYGNEGYELTIEEEVISITAQTSTGIFYGIQTLKQLFLLSANLQRNTSTINLGCMVIRDKPKYEWRGIMLDPARYFLPVELLKNYINTMSFYKMNRLHLHLTDNVGWTVEMIKYPELNRQEDWPLTFPDRNRGVYTRKEIHDLVDYAKKRHVTIIPELELPGHNSIVGWVKRDILCPTNPYKMVDAIFTNSDSVENGIGINSIEWMEPCAGNKQTLEVYKNILTEFMEVFPSRYIHIGGDETFGHAWSTCPKCQDLIKRNNIEKYDTKKLQDLFSNCWGDKKKYLVYRYLMTYIADFVSSKDRIPILWDDLSWRGDFPENAIIMQWHYKDGWDTFEQIATPENPAVEAAQSGHKAIICPYSHLYFCYDSSFEDVYFFDPMPEELMDESKKMNILGPHACLWDQPIDSVFSKSFPRLYSLSQIAWSYDENKDFLDFKNRVNAHKGIVPTVTKGELRFNYK